MEQQKRPLTLAGAIMNIVAYALNILATAYMMFTVFIVLSAILDLGETSDNAEAMATIIGLVIGYVIRLALSIVVIVLSAKAIKISKMSVEDYDKKKGVLWACYIINIFLLCYGIFSVMGDIENVTPLVFIDVVLWILYCISAVFFAIDLSKHKKAMDAKKLADAAAAAAANATAEAKPAETTDAKADNIDKLAELNKMKEDGLISEEEYENMKKDLLK